MKLKFFLIILLFFILNFFYIKNFALFLYNLNIEKDEIKKINFLKNQKNFE
jgi:hypothetical protein